MRSRHPLKPLGIGASADLCAWRCAPIQAVIEIREAKRQLARYEKEDRVKDAAKPWTSTSPSSEKDLIIQS